ncbi:MAG: FtsH protease activity modulator HflK [Alphaproteobacteria bacterium]|nr:MAG: FtsH protease activity modulator HflK [Alphaproteobacteria bacterium]
MPWQSSGGGGNDWRGGQSNPWGGRRPPSSRPPGGSPDFEAAIRRFQQALRRWLPGGGGKAGLALVGIVFLLIWAATGIYQVRPNEQGVVLRFGKWVYTTGPGLHWHLPWPIESALTPAVTDINRVDIGFSTGLPRSARTARQLEEGLMLTGDENIVDVAFTVFWQIKDAGKFLFNIEPPQTVTVKAVAESVMREIIGKTPIQDALTAGRNRIEKEATRKIQDVLDGYDAGIFVREVKLEKVDPPAEVIDAFREVQAAAADRERFRNEAERYANKIIPEARGRAAQMRQQAEAYREQVIARAEGQAARFLSVYEQYRQAKDITRKRMYLETMEEILDGMSKVLIDRQAGGSGVVPYLALPELHNRGKGGQPIVSPAASSKGSGGRQ